MGRHAGPLLILLLFALNLALPYTPLGRRGSDAAVRHDVPGAAGAIGERLPDFELPDLDGRPLRLSDLRGHRVVLTFERSLDW
jgi:cytochrome oxidase Cu insertion factor (SCO1/SenC/PrrC family)